MEKINIIILNYKSLPVTRECIDSLEEKETYPFRVILVNNDIDIKLTSKFFQYNNIEVINTKENLGFAKGVNIGIREALKGKVDYILLLNNDTCFEKPVLQSLLTTIKERGAGIVGPVLSYKNNGRTMYDLGGNLNSLFLRTSHKEVAKITSKSSQEVTYVSGGAMLIKREVFEQIGFFDEQFFLYYEDADFCLRAKKQGFSIYMDPTSIVFHKLTSTIGKGSNTATYHLLRSSILFGKKYANTFLLKLTNKFFILFQSGIFWVKFPSGRKGITRALKEYI